MFKIHQSTIDLVLADLGLAIANLNLAILGCFVGLSFLRCFHTEDGIF